MMHVDEFLQKLNDIVDNYKTLYVSGCFGAPMTSQNKQRYSRNNEYNRNPQRASMITSASSDTFGFDCVNLIKGIIWGWNGDLNKSYGGAVYASNGLGDISEDAMINNCKDANATSWDKMDPGEVVWMPGHIGVYVGKGTVIECSPKWKNCVQRTAIANVTVHPNLNTRFWKKHGHIPYIDYTRKEEEEVTYEQFVQYMDRYLDERSKLPAADWSKTDIDEAFDEGILGNKEWPQSFATRQDLVAMIMRAYRKAKN